jgi:hypothetical protein
MPIYDFRCTKCNSEFTVPADSDEEIRDFFCLECRAGFGSLEILNYERDENPLAHIFKELNRLQKQCEETSRRLARIRGHDKKAPKLTM